MRHQIVVQQTKHLLKEESNMTMQKFEKQRIIGIPTITVRKNGSISFNEMAVEQFPIREKKHADLYFDQEDQTIGTRPIDSKAGVAAFAITREKGKTYTISCQSFLRQFGVAFTLGSKVYPASYDDSQEMIIAKII
jgi:hypothetical protein